MVPSMPAPAPARSGGMAPMTASAMAGFVAGPEVQLTEKRARLVFLEREAFTGA
jgi:hypothetical protein